MLEQTMLLGYGSSVSDHMMAHTNTNYEHAEGRSNIISFSQYKTTDSSTTGISTSASNLYTLKRHNQCKIKPKAADPVKALSDIHRIQEYFISKGDFRDNMLFVLGISTGLRISDLVSLRIRDVLEADNRTFKKSIDVITKKTQKHTVSPNDEVLITEAAKIAINMYFDSINSKFCRDDYLFTSQRAREGSKKHAALKTDKNLYRDKFKGQYVISETTASGIFKKVQRDLNLPYNLSSHSMRKTFANALFFIFSRAKVKGANSDFALTMVQIALQHEKALTTMRYIGNLKETILKGRNKVSDFILGKTIIDNLEVEIEIDI